MNIRKMTIGVKHTIDCRAGTLTAQAMPEGCGLPIRGDSQVNDSYKVVEQNKALDELEGFVKEKVREGVDIFYICPSGRIIDSYGKYSIMFSSVLQWVKKTLDARICDRIHKAGINER